MLSIVLLVISGLFVFMLLAKNALNKKWCALCTAVFLSWAGLFALYKLGRFEDTVLLGLLIGQSVTGLFYLAEKRVQPALRIFSLPFYLTLSALAYLAITASSRVLPPLIVLLGVWVAAYVVFINRNDPGRKPVAQAVMDCCGDR